MPATLLELKAWLELASELIGGELKRSCAEVAEDTGAATGAGANEVEDAEAVSKGLGDPPNKESAAGGAAVTFVAGFVTTLLIAEGGG